MDCSTPGFFVLHYLPEISQFMSTESMMLSHPLPLLLLPSIFLSTSISVSLCIPWPKNWSLSFSISLPNEYSGLISFTIDCFHLLAVQETQESSPAPQFESINSLAVSLLYGLTSVHGYWKNHSFDYMGLCWQSDVSFCHNFSSKEQESFNVLAAVTVCHNFGALYCMLSCSVMSPSLRPHELQPTRLLCAR